MSANANQANYIKRMRKTRRTPRHNKQNIEHIEHSKESTIDFEPHYHQRQMEQNAKDQLSYLSQIDSNTIQQADRPYEQSNNEGLVSGWSNQHKENCQKYRYKVGSKKPYRGFSFWSRRNSPPKSRCKEQPLRKRERYPLKYQSGALICSLAPDYCQNQVNQGDDNDGQEKVTVNHRQSKTQLLQKQKHVPIKMRSMSPVPIGDSCIDKIKKQIIDNLKKQAVINRSGNFVEMQPTQLPNSTAYSRPKSSLSMVKNRVSKNAQKVNQSIKLNELIDQSSTMTAALFSKQHLIPRKIPSPRQNHSNVQSRRLTQHRLDEQEADMRIRRIYEKHEKIILKLQGQTLW